MNRTIIIGEKYRGLFEQALSALFDIVYLPDNPDVAPALSGHCDLSVFSTGNELILAPYLLGSSFEEEMRARGVVYYFDNTQQSAKYPFDCALNAACIGDFFICNSKYCSGFLQQLMLDRGKKLLSVNQGYVRCTSLFVGSEAVITADPGVAAVLEGASLDVLRISDSGICLPGYDHGFIGGASFVYDNTVLFFGDVSRHSSFDSIKSFLEGYGYNIVSLPDIPLTDIGGAVIL